jgi:hypothetical protein
MPGCPSLDGADKFGIVIPAQAGIQFPVFPFAKKPKTGFPPSRE